MKFATAWENGRKYEELIPSKFISYWYLGKNIPEDFKNMGNIFILKNKNGELNFSAYKGFIKKVSKYSDQTGKEVVVELVEV